MWRVVMAAAVALVAWAGATAVPAAASEGALDVQALVDAAPVGATVTLPAGTHTGPVTIDHPMRLVGVPGAAIDGRSVGSVVTIAAPGVELAGLTLMGSGRNSVGAPSGVLIQQEGDRAHVHDVAIRGCYLGITVQRAADVVLERVDIEGSGIITGEMHVSGEDGTEGEAAQLRGDGIWLYDAPRPIVRDNSIRTVRDGIYIAYGTDAVIQDNLVEDGRYAIHDMYATGATIEGNTLRESLSGIVVMYGGPVRVAGNTILDNGSPSTGFGILIKDAGEVTVERNVIADNRVGVLIDDAGRTGAVATLVKENTIAMNQLGAMLVPSADPTFTQNAFIENSTQVSLAGAGFTQAVWSLDGVGNHWSDYGGFDANGDGTGDLAYTRSGRTSQLIAEEPMLIALASGPAFRLLSAVEDKWLPGEALVRDEAPQVDAATPAIVANGRGASVALWIPGGLLVLVCTGALLSGRRQRRHG